MADNPYLFGWVLYHDIIIGRVLPTTIAGKRCWRAYDTDGRPVPVVGNRAHKTREAAAEALVEAVGR